MRDNLSIKLKTSGLHVYEEYLATIETFDQILLRIALGLRKFEIHPDFGSNKQTKSHLNFSLYSVILATVLNKCFKSRLSLCEADRRKCCVRSDREAYFLKKIVLKLLTPAYLVTGNTLKRKQSLMGVHVTQPTVPKSKLF